ncbi:ATP-binding protein [Peribacillus sp. SCS-155]|uniref:ATP-binding protein n=1 Tax=Peribacillus sedimenti TaxID=3115297 RepID=UPI0039060CD6
MRDPLMIPYKGEILVVATDNSGGIGMKEQDNVHVPYKIVGYFGFRVAVMECIAARAHPFSVILHNFCGEEHWNALVEGIQQGMMELGLDIPISGSTETNMNMVQSAVGLNVLGMAEKNTERSFQEDCLAVIGIPLVGDEVLYNREYVAPLSLFSWFSKQSDVTILPVGSKGIFHEIKNLFPEAKAEQMATNVDLYASAGPATCFLISYPKVMESDIIENAGQHFHKIRQKHSQG